MNRLIVIAALLALTACGSGGQSAGYSAPARNCFHYIPPSDYEASLANADPVRNPRAVALLAGVQADRESAENRCN